MNIPLITNLGPDGIIISGEYAGREHYYKTALYNSLLALKPVVCLEIGTLHGGTAVVFERYYQKYRLDGLTVTADIKIYKALQLKHVEQVKVYPHAATLGLHNVEESDLLPGGTSRWQESVELNIEILRDALLMCGREPVADFAFIDGDHRTVSAAKDITIAKALTRPPHYILLEDVREGIHEVSRMYAETVVNEWAHYDFSEWPVLSGTALIWKE